MKDYPSISRTISRDLQVYAFDKLDGSQIRGEWTRKNGLCKFGSRRVLIGHDSFLAKSIEIIRSKYEDDLARIFRKEQFDKVTCFFEFYGPLSFAGQHIENDSHDAVLFDLDVYKKGILNPSDYLKLVGKLHIAKLLHVGRTGPAFEESVRDSKLAGMTFEGVVCKSPAIKRTPVMFKIKSKAWLEKLKDFCAGDYQKFNLLM